MKLIGWWNLWKNEIKLTKLIFKILKNDNKQFDNIVQPTIAKPVVVSHNKEGTGTLSCSMFSIHKTLKIEGSVSILPKEKNIFNWLNYSLKCLEFKNSTKIINPLDAEITFVQCTKKQNIIKNHLNPIILVFIWKLSLSTLRLVPICKGFSHFSAFFHHFMLTKLGTSSLRVKGVKCMKIKRLKGWQAWL